MDFILIAADSTLAYYGMIAWSLAKAAMGLGFVIFVHELGHFAVAKFCGVKCEKFYIGFDVPIKIGPLRLQRICRFQWGETEYGIGIIPLGGYVKMLGQDDDPRNAQREAERIRLANAGKNERERATADGTAAEARTPGERIEDAPMQLDPRSYPAKSVPARIAIISAGVIMNLIFAVLMAAVAFRVGVPYGPTLVGATSPGDPAWRAGLERMDRIVQIGDRGEPSQHLRWQWDLLQSVGEAGLGDPPETLRLVVDKAATGERVEYKITPSDRLKEVVGYATLGIRPLGSTTLRRTIGLDHVVPESIRQQLAAADRVIAVNGRELSRDQANWRGDIPDAEFEELMYELRDQPVTLTFARPDNPDNPSADRYTTFDIAMPPRAQRTLGLEMTIGPIVGVQQGSPADLAGFKAGDRIQTIQGQAAGDPLRLPELVFELPDGEITVEVLRTEGESSETLELQVTPQKAWHYGILLGRGERISLNSLGLAYDIETVVSGVASGSPAESAGLQSGDRVTHVEFIAANEAKAKLSGETIDSFWYGDSGKAVELDKKLYTWADIHQHMQVMLLDTQVQLTIERQGQSQTVQVSAVDAADWFNSDRGLAFGLYEERHRVESLVAAMPAAVHRTGQELVRVAAMLKKLVTGQVSPKHLGGPITIARVAGSEAAQGIPQLMMFLVFLSANLAILNFLPIPALDGGHFVFLLWEGITGKPADERVQGALTLIGVTCLLGLILFVSFNDVGRMIFSS